jgi:large subunit ribosomal protein L18
MNKDKRQKRHKKIRSVVKGTAARPRLFVFRSNQHIYASLIDDDKGVTLATVNDFGIKGSKTEKSIKVGEMITEKATAAKITEIVFDRGGYKYHGRVKALADSAREKGLKF